VKVTQILSLAVLAATCASVANADIVYKDNFDGTTGTISGRAATVATGLDGGTAAATWTSDAAPVAGGNPDAVWQASGGTYTVTGSTSGTIGALSTGADANLITNAWLPFTPQAGFIYDFHIAIESSNVGASTNWLGATFAPANMNGHTTGGGSSALSNLAGAGLIIVKGSGQVQSFGGVGTANGALNSAAGFLTTGQYNSVDIVLNTSAAAWTVSWLVNGVTPSGIGSTSFTYATNPSIGNVVFGTNKLTGAVSDFSLTATAVPEPASLSALALGGLALLARRRK
jgi:hypothetical protein